MCIRYSQFVILRLYTKTIECTSQPKNMPLPDVLHTQPNKSSSTNRSKNTCNSCNTNAKCLLSDVECYVFPTNVLSHLLPFLNNQKNTHKHNLPRQRSNLSQDQGTPRDLVPKIRFSKAWHKPMPLRPAILRCFRTVRLAGGGKGKGPENLVVVNPGDGEKLDINLEAR